MSRNKRKRQTPSPGADKTKEEEGEEEDSSVEPGGIGGTPMSPALLTASHSGSTKLKTRAILEHYISFVGSAQNFHDVDTKHTSSGSSKGGATHASSSNSGNKRKRKKGEEIPPVDLQIPLLRPSASSFCGPNVRHISHKYF